MTKETTEVSNWIQVTKVVLDELYRCEDPEALADFTPKTGCTHKPPKTEAIDCPAVGMQDFWELSQRGHCRRLCGAEFNRGAYKP